MYIFDAQHIHFLQTSLRIEALLLMPCSAPTRWKDLLVLSLLAVLVTAGFALPRGGGGAFERAELPEGSRSQAPPNILVFVADDAGWQDFGAYGSEVVQTPAIDSLARAGLLVERAFLTTPQCSPSRISILTGRYPHATGAEDLHMPLPEGRRILPAHLSEAGYFTGHLRKTHYGPHADAQFDWYSEDLRDIGAFIEESGERPFFLWVGFEDPHRPYDEAPVAPARHEAAEVQVPPHLADTPETRADLVRYYDEIARMDANIGRMLAELRQRGRADDTLVLFLSDNGAPFPRAKGSLYDAGIRTPLIAVWPGVIEPGTRTDALTSVIDLAPTLLDVAGLAPSEEMQGRSLRALFEDPPAYAGREYVFSERNWHDTDEHMRSVRTPRYKLIRNAYIELPFGHPADVSSSPSWYSLKRLHEQGALSEAQRAIFRAPRPAIELYDLDEDPWELNNLAGQADHAQTAYDLSRVLAAWMEETGDFPPTARLRQDHTDRVTGVWFSPEIPPMRNDSE